MPFDSFGTFVLLVLEADFITQQKNVGHFCHGEWLAGVASMVVFVAFFCFFSLIQFLLVSIKRVGANDYIIDHGAYLSQDIED